MNAIIMPSCTQRHTLAHANMHTYTYTYTYAYTYTYICIPNVRTRRAQDLVHPFESQNSHERRRISGKTSSPSPKRFL